MIDYVDSSFYGTESDENGLFLANVVASAEITFADAPLDASDISSGFLQESLHEADGAEANVATGYRIGQTTIR